MLLLCSRQTLFREILLSSEKNRKSSVGDFEVGHCCSIGNTLTPCVCLCVWREFATDIMMMMQSRFNKKNFQSLKNAFQMMHKFIKLPSRFNYINFQVENCPLPHCIPLCFAVEKFRGLFFFLSILSLVWLYFFCGLGQWSAGPCETFSSLPWISYEQQREKCGRELELIANDALCQPYLLCYVFFCLSTVWQKS